MKRGMRQESETLLDMLHQACRDNAEKTAFVNFGESLSYARLERLSDQLAAYLLQCQALEAGDRVALMLPNLLQYPVALAAILKAGLVAVNTNPLYTAHELHHQLSDSGARAIIILEDKARLLQELPAKTELHHVLVTGVGDMLGRFKKTFFAIRYQLRFRRPLKRIHADRWSDALANGEQLLREQAQARRRLDRLRQETQASSLAFLQYTGGTTGTPKGAMLTHRNLLSNVRQMAEFFPALQSGSGQETILTALPLYHIFSLTVNLLLFIKLGHRNALITDPRRTGHLIAVLKRESPNIITAVNTLLQSLLKHRRFARLDFSSLHTTIGGGMAIYRDTAERWQNVTGCIVLQGYGLTETSPVVSVNPPTAETFNGSVGLALPDTEIKISRPTGEAAARGEAGELLVRGPQVMGGYWRQAEETAKVLDSEGWLKTGDIAYKDKNAYLFLVDRSKNVIIVSGFNVYPNEVEDALYKHPDIQEAACIGVDDDRSGQAVKAFVVLRKKSRLDKDEIMRFCRRLLSGYKTPKHIEFIDELPKSAAGKILHRQLGRAKK